MSIYYPLPVRTVAEIEGDIDALDKVLASVRKERDRLQVIAEPTIAETRQWRKAARHVGYLKEHRSQLDIELRAAKANARTDARTDARSVER